MDDTARGRLTKDGIRIYETADFAGMHQPGELAARIIDEIAPLVFPGQTTGEIDRVITEAVDAAGAKSATIGYKGYQHASCISVNHVVCHGIPGAKVLKDGDILNVDVTVIVDGWYDYYLDLAIADYNRMREQGGTPEARRSRLLIGPWSHVMADEFPDRDFGGEAEFLGVIGDILHWYRR